MPLNDTKINDNSRRSFLKVLAGLGLGISIPVQAAAFMNDPLLFLSENKPDPSGKPDLKEPNAMEKVVKTDDEWRKAFNTRAVSGHPQKRNGTSLFRQIQ
jgi:hypothetical protein